MSFFKFSVTVALYDIDGHTNSNIYTLSVWQTCNWNPRAQLLAH